MKNKCDLHIFEFSNIRRLDFRGLYMGVIATDQDTGIAITVCFTLAGSSDDFIVHLKQSDIYQNTKITITQASGVT